MAAQLSRGFRLPVGLGPPQRDRPYSPEFTGLQQSRPRDSCEGVRTRLPRSRTIRAEDLISRLIRRSEAAGVPGSASPAAAWPGSWYYLLGRRDFLSERAVVKLQWDHVIRGDRMDGSIGVRNQLFLSYRSLERAFAAKLAADLKNAGFALWMDSLDIRPSDDWARSIEQAIDGCAGMVAVVSPAYVTSEICRAELGRAHSAGRPIFPVVLEALASEDDWPLLIQNRQYVDFSQWQETSSYRARVDELLRALYERFEEQAGQPPDLELQYLNLLLAELESKRGVLEYVGLESIAEEQDNILVPADEWAFDVLLDVEADDAKKYTTRLYDVEELLREHPRVVLLGEAGTGKTTTLRWVARRAALARKSDPRTRPLPVLLYLGQWQAGQSFSDFLLQSCPPLRDVDPSLAAIDLLLLLDGLNEMGSAGPERAQELGRWLSNSFSSTAMITCRSGDYGQLQLSDFPTAVLRELEEDQIRQFAGRYLLGQAPEFLAQVLPGARDPKDAIRAIASLARNPYMLSAFIYLYQHNSTQALPDNAGVLFSRLSRALWEREQRRKRVVSEPAQTGWPQFKDALARLARSTIEHDAGEDLPISQALDILGQHAAVTDAVDANLLVRNGEFVRFYQDLLRLYFIAESLAQADVSAFDEWCRQHPKWWLPVATAWSALSPHADAFLEHMHWQDAADVMGRGYLAGNDACQKHVQQGMRELSSGYWRDFEPAMKALAKMGQAAVPALIAKLGEDNAEMREKVAVVLGLIGSADAVDVLIPLLDDPSSGVRGRVRIALAEIGGQRALSSLAERINDEAADVRAAAVRAYANLAMPGAVGSVLALADDPDGEVRRAAIESLGRLGDPSAAARLAGHANEEDPAIRAAAVAALGRLGGDEARDCVIAALRDPIGAVRVAAAAAEVLGPAAVPPLLEALRDEDKDVRLQAAATLGRLHDDRALESLVAALTDESTAVRTEAARALGMLGDHARGPMLELLRGDDPALWEVASKVLGRQGWTPVDVPDQVRFAVAASHWGSCLAIGIDAIPELRHLLQLADWSRQRGVAETLRKLGWQPGELDLDLFRYHSALVDWDRERGLSLAELLDLRAWLGPPEPAGKPVLEQVEKMLRELPGRPCGEPLMTALEEEPETVRYFATVTAGRAQCTAAMMPTLINLVSPQLSFPLSHWNAAIICGQALAQIGDQSIIPALIEHAGKDPDPGPYVGKTGALAAIQAAARLAELPHIFQEIPATTLGKAADPEDLFDLWLHFGLKESASLEQASVAVVLDTIGEFDKSELPSSSPLFSEAAIWELHQRMAVLTLTLLPAATPVFLRQPLVDAAMRSIGSLAAVPVLRQVAQWGIPKVKELAAAQLGRMLREQG